VLREPNWQGTYPVEADSPVADLLFGGEVIGDVRLEGDELRIALYPASGGLREFALDRFIATLEAASRWVRGEEPASSADPS
jgi:hypothetical protein